MSMVRFSPIALNFGYDFVLLEFFFGTHDVSRTLWDLSDIALGPLGHP